MASHTETTSLTIKKRKLKRFGIASRSTGLARKFYKEQCKEGEKQKRSIGRITCLSGKGCSFATPYEKLETKSNGGKELLCRCHPNGHHDYGIGAGVGTALRHA